MALASTLDVGAGHPYATMADAIADASSGDIVEVHDAFVSTPELVIRSTDLTFHSAIGTVWDLGELSVVDGAFTIEGFELTGIGSHHESGSLALVDVVVHDLIRPFDLFGADLVVTRTTFRDLHETVIQGTGAAATIEDSAFERNDAVGTMLQLEHAAVVVRRSRFEDDEAQSMLSCPVTCTVEDSTFAGNIATAQVVFAGALEARRNLFCGNSDLVGGSLLILGGPATIENNAFLDTTASGTGGVNALAGVVTASHNDFLGLWSFLPEPGLVWSDGTLDAARFDHNLVAGSTGAAGPLANELQAGPLVVGWNAFYGNTPGDASWAPDPTELYGVDPELLSWTSGQCSWEALVRSRTSPLRDAGDPTVLDADGTPVDIGALGGPGAPTIDVDGDGVPYASDCDDLDAASFPGAVEIADDGIDQDCDGVDGVDPSTATGETGDTGTDEPTTPTDPTGTDPDPEPDDTGNGTKDDSDDRGCGCATGTPPLAWIGWAPGVVLLRRRRRLAGR